MDLATNNDEQQIGEDNYMFDLKIANPYTDITAEEAYNMINNKTLYPDLVILDVRSQGEYDTYHICDAILIPYAQLESRIGELDPFKDTEIIVYCGSGFRSRTACGILDSYSFTKVFNMLGGILAWTSEGYDTCTGDFNPPIWDEIPTDQLFEYGEAFTYDLNASDPSGIDEWWINDTTYFEIDGYGAITNKILVPIDEYWLEVNVNDTYGNTLTDQFKITVEDTLGPTWDELPRDQLLGYGESFTYDLNASDPSGIDKWWLNDTMYFDIDGSGVITNKTLVPIGEYWLEVNVNDTFDNTLKDIFKIRVGDIIGPTWEEIPSDRFFEYGEAFSYDLNATDPSGIDEWWLNDTTYFDIDGSGVITNKTLVPVGEYRLEVKVNDTYGNTLTDQFKITVEDTIAPTWGELPMDQFFEYGEAFSCDLNATDLSGIDKWWLNNTVNFDIDGNGVITNKILIPIGEYWLEVSVNDTSGNILTASFKVTIQDTKPPSWVFPPSDITMEFGSSFNYDLYATDLSNIDTWWLNDTLFFNIDNDGLITSTGPVPIDVYWLEVSVNDTLGNILTASFKVTVQDTIAPSWDENPTDQLLEYGEAFTYDLNATDISSIDKWWLNDTEYFDVDGNGVITNKTLVPVGEYWLNLNVNDTSGNILTDSFKITIRDTKPPSWVLLPLDKTIEIGLSFNYDLNATDLSGIGSWDLNDTNYFNIDGSGIITNKSLVPAGIYWLEVTVKDNYNNSLVDKFKITVEDTTPPSWSPEPTDQYIDFGDGLNYDLNATDLSGIKSWELNDTTYFNIDNNGKITNITTIIVGIYWLEVRVYDIFDNQRTKAFRVIVQDIDAPVWIQVPSHQIMEFGTTFNYHLNASDSSGIYDWWLNDTFYFNIDDVTGVISNISQIPLGEYWLEARAYDPYGQYCSAEFKITVEDTIAPTWDEIPIDQLLEYGEVFTYDLNASDVAGIDFWWLNNTTYFDIDNATGVITNIGQVPIGNYWLEVAACDFSNHNCSATIKITVQDTIDPMWIEMPIDQNIKLGDDFYYDLNASDASGIDHYWLNDTSNFVIDEITGLITNAILLEEEMYWLEVRAYDSHGLYCSSN
ncbi:MAG: rhodanese-like domain-containing protein, partial [Candidatus Hermodarchaeota archaeon]